MTSGDITFTKEYTFSVKCDDTSFGAFRGQLLNYQFSSGTLMISHEDFSTTVTILSHEAETRKILDEYKDRCLLRIEKVIQSAMTMTLLQFYRHIRMDFSIVVDQSINREFLNLGLDVSHADTWVRNEVLLNGGYCFSLGENKDDAEIVLLGKNYRFRIAESAQGYRHIISIQKSRNRVAAQLVSMISGDIRIEDATAWSSAMNEYYRDQYKNLIQDNVAFIALWDTYDRFFLECAKQDAVSMGYLRYKKYTRSRGQLVFNIVENHASNDFYIDSTGYMAIATANFNPLEPLNYDKESAIYVGTEYVGSDKETSIFKVVEDTTDSFRVVPDAGFLIPSISGDMTQSRRRSRARDRILSGMCALQGLQVLLQSGQSTGFPHKHTAAVTDKLEQKLLGRNKHAHFTDSQKNAIKIAINTPDIAVIQGPPGTGKTLVIRAIVERLHQLNKGKDRILITSAQHDAVDNAIEGITYGGIPVNRAVGGRRRSAGDSSVYQWIDSMIDNCSQWLLENAATGEDPNSNIFECLNELESAPAESVAGVLEQLYQFLQSMNYPPELLSEVSMLLVNMGVNRVTSVSDEGDQMLSELIANQRTDSASFAIDGADNLNSLRRYMMYEAEFDYTIPEYWTKLGRMKTVEDELDSLLARFTDDLSTIRSLIGGSMDQASTETNEAIRAMINKIKDAVNQHGNADTHPKKKYDLIWSFKHELSSIENAKKLVSSYSQINAATCQQSASRTISLGMNGFDEVYDYVIIDEAARSNPLDLLIPMSMGKRIILVGDHKQLPHMVDEDVVNQVAVERQDESVKSVLRESLFQRLYTMVSSSDSQSHKGFSRTCQLNEQFRMHPAICELMNKFYEGHLRSLCSAEEKAHSLGLYDDQPLAWLDVPIGVHRQEESDSTGFSLSRSIEVQEVSRQLSKILARNQEYSIGIITFYRAQAALLRGMVEKEFPGDQHRIAVGTVDAFQGREFDIVLLSTVRSNTHRDLKRRVGFLDNHNRLCVAFSRAKRLLVAVGDSQTVAYNGSSPIAPPLYELLQRCKERNAGYYEVI